MNSIAFCNLDGGLGRTSLVYHLAWMYAELGLNVLVADLDPQANLSAMFLDEDRLEELWPEGPHPQTILGAVQPIIEGTGDIAKPHVETVPENDALGLVVGDLGLSRFEDILSDAWPRCLDGDVAAYRKISAFWRGLRMAAEEREVDVVLLDVGPNLGAINRAALVAARHVVVPLAPDLFSLQGLRNLGPTLRTWRKAWADRLERKPPTQVDLELPPAAMAPVGYVVLQHAVRLDRPVKAYDRWIRRIPGEYRRAILDESSPAEPGIESDPHCLATLKHYRSLMPLAMEARKPMFKLTAADGAIGGHMQAVTGCHRDFRELARRIADRCGVILDLPVGPAPAGNGPDQEAAS